MLIDNHSNNMIKKIASYYQNLKVLYYQEYDYHHFHYTKVGDYLTSVFAFYREVDDEVALTIFNVGETSFPSYDIGVPYSGEYNILINTLDLNGQKTLKSIKSQANDAPDNQPHFISLPLLKYQGYLIYLKKGK
jgi:1,4-alpha-glucan branching enzyme